MPTAHLQRASRAPTKANHLPRTSPIGAPRRPDASAAASLPAAFTVAQSPFPWDSMRLPKTIRSHEVTACVVLPRAARPRRLRGDGTQAFPQRLFAADPDLD